MNRPRRDRNKDTRGLRTTIIWLSLALVMMAGCFAANFDGAWMGGPAKFTQFIVTVVYIIFWGIFAVSTQRHIMLVRVSFTISLLTFIGAVTVLIMRLINVGFIFAALFGIFTIVPFYGFRLLMDWTPCYAIALVISLVWLIYSLRNLRTIRNQT